MLNFTAGASAIRASQTALDTIANNIANANNPNYHRRVVQLSSRPDLERLNLLIGLGVDVSRIQRLQDDIVAQTIKENISETGSTSARGQVARRIESLLTPKNGSIHDRTQLFLNDLERLSASPDDVTLRQSVIDKAGKLADSFNGLSQNFQQLAGEVDAEIDQVIKTINKLAPTIVELNRQITTASNRGLDPNSLLDERDALVNQLAEYVDVTIAEQGAGHTVVIMGDNALAGDSFDPLRIEVDDNGQLILRQGDAPRPTTVTSGKLEGLITSRNDIIPEFQTRIDTLAHEIISNFNQIHASGVGLDGPFAQLQTHHGVRDVNATLSTAGLPFDIEAGELYVSVLDKASNERTLYKLNIDPDTQTLNDVAASVSSIDHLQAVINPNNGEVTILAERGYGFDFTGNLQSVADTTLVTGSSVPRFSGRYSGDSNESYQFDVQGTGTVGVTAGLLVEVRDSQGQLVTTLDVGQQYQPGKPLDLGDGVSVSFGSGSLNAGDQFLSELVATPDTTGVLVALGLNPFFVGDGAATIGTAPTVSSSHRNLATSRSGLPGDAANLHAMANLRSATVFGSSRITMTEELGTLTAASGTLVQQLAGEEDQLGVLRQNLDAERNALSGVDPNEELVRMLEFQRAFQVASRFIATVDRTLDELMNIVG